MRRNFFKFKFQYENRKIYKDIERNFNFFNKTQYWSVNDLENLQFEYFKKLLKFSIKNVPYYKKLLKENNLELNDFNSIADLNKIPVLTKDIIRGNMQNMKAVNLGNDRFVLNSTSGYSGSNFQFYTDPDAYALKLALIQRRYEWMNVSNFDKEFIVWGASWDLSQNNLFAKTKRLLSIENKINYSGYNLSEKDVLNIYKLLNTTNPLIIKSYPSILSSICDVFDKYNYTFKPKAIHIGGEKLYEYQKLKIENTFQTKVFDFYGARDMPNIAQNCDNHTGLHTFMEGAIVEVLDENDEPITEGEGNLAITNLHNFSFPMIRYKIGDRAKISKGSKCTCGRNLKIIDEIIGRTFDIINFPNGNKVGGSFWTLLMRSVPGIEDFQVIQNTIDQLEINYTINSIHNFEIDFLVLEKRIKEYSGEDISIKFNKTETISRTSAGKMKFIFNNINK